MLRQRRLSHHLGHGCDGHIMAICFRDVGQIYISGSGPRGVWPVDMVLAAILHWSS